MHTYEFDNPVNYSVRIVEINNVSSSVSGIVNDLPNATFSLVTFDYIPFIDKMRFPVTIEKIFECMSPIMLSGSRIDNCNQNFTNCTNCKMHMSR